MDKTQFAKLRKGDRVYVCGRPHTVTKQWINWFPEPYSLAGELMVDIVPDEGDYTEQVGIGDARVAQMEIADGRS